MHSFSPSLAQQTVVFTTNTTRRCSRWAFWFLLATVHCLGLGNGGTLPPGAVPSGYKVINNVECDLNSDGAKDRALLVQAPKKLGGKRAVIILLSRGNSLKQILRSEDFLDGKWTLSAGFGSWVEENLQSTDSSCITLEKRHYLEPQHYLSEFIRLSYDDDSFWLSEYETVNNDHMNFVRDIFDFADETYHHIEDAGSDSETVTDDKFVVDGTLNLATMNATQLDSYIKKHYKIKGYSYRDDIYK